MEKVEVRKATFDDLSILVPLVARAFHPQPLTCWLLGRNDKALKRGQRLIELEFEKALPYQLTYTTHGLQGAALWHPPDKKLELWPDLLWSLNSAAAIGLSRRYHFTYHHWSAIGAARTETAPLLPGDPRCGSKSTGAGHWLSTDKSWPGDLRQRKKTGLSGHRY
jgi:hypothetical protein